MKKNLTFEEVAARLDEIYNNPTLPEVERHIKMQVILPNEKAAKKFHSEFNNLMSEEANQMISEKARALEDLNYKAAVERMSLKHQQSLRELGAKRTSGAHLRDPTRCLIASF